MKKRRILRGDAESAEREKAAFLLNSGVPTPLAPSEAACWQYKALGSVRIASAKHGPQGGYSRERGQQSNLLCLAVSRLPRLSGYNAAPAARCSPVAGFYTPWAPRLRVNLTR